MSILELTAGHFAKERLFAGDTVRIFATADATEPMVEAAVRSVSADPKFGIPGADFVPFSIQLECPRSIAEAGIDVWVAGADWGPIGPVHVFRVGRIGAPDQRAAYLLGRN